MVLFFPVQQELDCISGSGAILGKIQFDGAKDKFVFIPDNDSVVLTADEQRKIEAKLAALASGEFAISMQDDD